MSSYVVCVPSYKRAELCRDKTLNTLESNGIHTSVIHVFVANKKEYDEYSRVISGRANIHIGVKGLVQQREFISNMFPPSTWIIFMDDDIESIDMSLSSSFNTHTLHSFIIAAFKETVAQRAYIWGVYPVFNPFYRAPRKEITTGLSYIVGAFYGIINRPQMKQLRLHITRKNGQKEDVERSIKYFLHDGVVIRFNRIGFVTKYYGKTGGLGTFEARLQPMKEAALKLKLAYPDIGDVVVRKTGMTEFRLVKKYTFKAK